MTRTDPVVWARMGMPAEWIRERLPAAEAYADASGKMGSEWTKAVRGRLWACWRERWRDPMRKLEEKQRELERSGRRRKASSTVDVGEALRRMLEPR